MAKKSNPTQVLTDGVDDVRKVCQNIGDTLTTSFNKTKDLKTVQTAIQAYNGALSAMKAQLIYKKLTGGPAKIDFFETK